MNTDQRSLELHESCGGKLSVVSKVPILTKDDLSLAYTPGVAAPCREIAKNPEEIYRYTIKKNTVAVVTDGSAVLSLGNIGPAASLPVMEGKCVLFQKFAGIDAFPICVEAKTVDEFVDTVKRIAAPFGGINLEDIGAPHCFEIEERLSNELDIPVMHDDQHGTAIVVLAALINALKVIGKKFEEIKIVVSGSGAAGSAITKLLLAYSVRDIIVCDSKGAIHRQRGDISSLSYKRELAALTNPHDEKGSLAHVLVGADVFIGVSRADLVTSDMVSTMAKDSIVFALANPAPEIMPDKARLGGAVIVGTGRSDFPNQINNALAFPGVFRGLLDSRARKITVPMKITAAKALAGVVKNPDHDTIVPDIFADGVQEAVATAIVDSIL